MFCKGVSQYSLQHFVVRKFTQYVSKCLHAVGKNLLQKAAANPGVREGSKHVRTPVGKELEQTEGYSYLLEVVYNCKISVEKKIL